MLRVCIVISKSEIGGAQYWVANLILALGVKAEITLITSEAGWLTKKVDEQCKKIYFIEELVKFSVSPIISLRKVFREKDYDVVILNSAYSGIYGRIANLALNSKIIYVSHGWSAVYSKSRLNFIYMLMEYLFSFITHKIWCVSSNDEEVAKKRLRINPNKIEKVITKIPDLPLVSLNVPSNNEVLFVARFTHPKRGDLLIEACRLKPFQGTFVERAI